MDGCLCFLSKNSGRERRRSRYLGSVILTSENNKISQILIKSIQHVGDKKHKVEVEMDDRKETREPYKLL